MKKKKARILLISKEQEIKEEVELTITEDLSYYFSLKDRSKNCFSLTESTFIRETSDMFLELYFGKNQEKMSKMYLKKEHLEYPLSLKVITYEKTSQQIEIDYELNQENYKFQIKIEGDIK